MTENYRHTAKIVKRLSTSDGNSARDSGGLLIGGFGGMTPGMAEFDRAARERLKTLLDQKKWSRKEASLRAGLNETYVAQLLDPSRNKKGGSAQAMTKLANAFGVSVSYLLTGRDDAGTNPQTAPVESTIINRLDNLPTLPVRGKTAAGQWMQIEIEEEHPPINAVQTRLRGQQFAFQVVGPSMDKRRIFSGDYVICVDPYDFGRSPQNGHIVVVERTNPLRGIERTVKELEITEDGVYRLWPRSTVDDPIYKTPIVVDPREMHEDDGTQVQIVGIVIKVQHTFSYA